MPSAALGASSDWDFKSLLKLSAEPVVCRDNDAPGLEAVRVLAKNSKIVVRSFTTPEEKSDFDSHFTDMAPANFYRELERLWVTSVGYVRKVEDVRDQLNLMRQNFPDSHGNKLHVETQVNPEVCKTFWNDLLQRGQVYIDRMTGIAYFFNQEWKTVLEIDHSSRAWCSYLSQYGLLSQDRLSQQVTESTIERATAEGEDVVVHRTSHFNHDTQTLYVNLGDNRVARITADTIKEDDNGCDGVLFLSPTKQPYNIDFQNLPTLKYGLRSIDTPLSKEFEAYYNTNETHLSAAGCQQMVMSRLITQMLAEYSSVRPLMIFKGEGGSGKTTLVQKIGWLLEGKNFKPQGADTDPRELETKLANYDLLTFDNLDDLSHRNGGTLDIIARAVTGGEITRRKLYSTATNQTYRITAHIWVTTRTNPLDRPDIAQRQILIPLSIVPKQSEETDRNEKEFELGFLANRDVFMAELLVRLKMVLASLRRQKLNKYPTEFRLRDFASLNLKVAHDEGWGAEMTAMLDGTLQDQQATAIEGNALPEIIRLLTGLEANRIREGMQKKSPLTLTATDLRIAMIRVYDKLKMENPFKNPQQLAYAVNREPTLFKSIGLEIIRDKKNKRNMYVFRPSEDVLCAAITEVHERLSEPYNLDTMPVIH